MGLGKNPIFCIIFYISYLQSEAEFQIQSRIVSMGEFWQYIKNFIANDLSIKHNFQDNINIFCFIFMIIINVFIEKSVNLKVMSPSFTN